MHITRYTDYSLRTLIYLAALEPGKRATIRDVADGYAISRNHLMKVVNNLNRKGYIHSVRGVRGGLELAREPEAINIGTFVREVESDFALVECLSESGDCCISPVCGLKGILEEALQNFLATLDRYTLADLLPEDKQPQLLRLLQIS